MKKIQITLIAMIAVCFSSCSDNKAADQITASMQENFQKIPDVIKDVNDLDSAKTASDELRKLGKNINAVLMANKDKKVSDSKYREMEKNMDSITTKTTALLEKKITELNAKDPAAAEELATGYQDLLINMSNGIQ